MDEIIDFCTDGTQVSKDGAFVTLRYGAKRRKDTTKGWEVLVQWKDCSTTWNDLKDVKESYPVHLAEYANYNGYSDEPVFTWWVKSLMKKRDIILSKVKSKYWVRTQKYGIRVPKDVREARKIDTEN